MTDRERNITGAAPEGGEDRQEARLRALFAVADPATDPSELLQQRVATMAAQNPARSALPESGSRIRWRLSTPWRIGLGLAGATALALVSVGIAPMWLAAQVLRRAEAAAGEVENAHVITWRVGSDGSRMKTSEEWQQGARSRTWELGGERIRLLANDKLWIYEPKLNRVTVQRQADASAHGATVSTLKEMVREYARLGWGDQIHLLADTHANGHRVHHVMIQRARAPERMLMQVDSSTDLPIQAEMQLKIDGQWVPEMAMEVRYNEPLPADLFTPDFPKSAPVFDLDHGRQTWEQYLARGIARERVGDRTIVIRDIQVNAEGDLFVLYTAGKYLSDESVGAGNHLASRDWDVEVKDDLGTVYQWWEGTWASNPHEPAGHRGYVFNGERLEGDYWIPVAAQIPWRPRRFTLTFRVNPVNLHAPYQGPPRKVPYQGPPRKPRYTEIASFTLPVRAPATALIPEYTPYMALGGLFSEESIRTSHQKARAFYARYEQSDLGKALEHYQELIRSHQQQERETGQPSFDPETWIDMGEVLRKMGRKEEARAALEEAVREAIYPNHTRQRAQEALEALKGELAWTVGHPAPSFSAADLDGHPQSPERYRGQVLLIDLWATWDEKTRADLPTLKALHDQYHGQGLAILGIGLDYQEPAFRTFVKEHNLPWPQVCDSKGSGSALGRSFGSPDPPRTFLIDRRGTIRAVDRHGAALQKAVGELIASR